MHVVLRTDFDHIAIAEKSTISFVEEYIAHKAKGRVVCKNSYKGGGGLSVHHKNHNYFLYFCSSYKPFEMPYSAGFSKNMLAM